MDGLIFKEAYPQGAVDVDAILASKARAQVVSNALQAGLVGLGVGVGSRGLQGLMNQVHRTLLPTKTTRTPSVVDMPVAGDEEEKIAGELLDKALNTFLHPVQTAKNMATGGGAKSTADVPFGWIPTVLAGAGATAAGWKGMDMLMDRSRERELEAQRVKARAEYEQALAAQSKVGQALHAELDTMFDALSEESCGCIEKAANLPALASNLYGLYALAAGVPAAVWAYEGTKKRQQSSLLESARKKYKRTRETARPTPVYVRPSPMQGGKPMKTAPDEEELEGSPLDKAAVAELASHLIGGVGDLAMLSHFHADAKARRKLKAKQKPDSDDEQQDKAAGHGLIMAFVR